MKLNFKNHFIDLDGQPISGDDQATVLSFLLAGDPYKNINFITQFSCKKAIEWAKQLRDNGIIEISDADAEQLKDAIEPLKNRGIANILCYQLQQSLATNIDKEGKGGQ